jgi:OOP family OmpA-OmpF porin
MRHKLFTLCVLSTGCVILTGMSGCATKKYVATQVSPVDSRVSKLETKTTEHGSSIETIEGNLSKTREQVTDLDNGLKTANKKIEDTSAQAYQAGEKANTAQKTATDAQKQASDAWAHAEDRTNTLQKYVDNMSSFRLAGSVNVTFPTNRSDLNEEARAALDRLAQDATKRKHFVLEVQGYTDNRGPQTVNLALSQKRADAVVRYLTGDQKVPLRAIYQIGTGSAAPVADNKTRQGRQQNRRVEIRLFAPESESPSALSSAQAR